MVGYKSPPVEHRFKPGQSGNPAGRPRAGSKEARPKRPRIGILDEKVEGRLDGKKVVMKRREVLVRIAARKCQGAFTDKEKAQSLRLQRLLIELKDEVDRAQAHIRRDERFVVICGDVRPRDAVTSLEDAADVAGFGRKAYLKCKSARVLLDSWVINEAFDHLGDRRLSREEQQLVLAAARTPASVNWPDWWEPDLRKRGRHWRAPQNPSAGPVQVKRPKIGYREWQERDRLRHAKMWGVPLPLIISAPVPQIAPPPLELEHYPPERPGNDREKID